MKAIEHKLFSHNQDMFIKFFDKFNREEIKKAIFTHLTNYPDDTLEHCRDYSAVDIKKYYGSEIVNSYAMHPKLNKPAILITRGNKTYYKVLRDYNPQ